MEKNLYKINKLLNNKRKTNNDENYTDEKLRCKINKIINIICNTLEYKYSINEMIDNRISKLIKDNDYKNYYSMTNSRIHLIENYNIYELEYNKLYKAIILKNDYIMVKEKINYKSNEIIDELGLEYLSCVKYYKNNVLINLMNNLTYIIIKKYGILKYIKKNNNTNGKF